MQVLIVDDDHMICRCLQQRVHWSEIGCEEPRVAYNGIQAIACIEEKQPDIVISDVKMPVMDGKELCRQIWEKYPEISVLFLSAYEDFATAQLAIRYDVKGYVLKPLDGDGLCTLENLLRDVVLRKGNEEFCGKILRDEYQSYLETVIKEQNIQALDEFFEKVSSLLTRKLNHEKEIWFHLCAPVVTYQHANRNNASGVIYENILKLKEEIFNLRKPERVQYLRDYYFNVMSRESNNIEDNNVVWEIQKVIREEFSDTELNVNALGRMFHMSPVYLGRIFIERTGMKLVDYISQQRIQFACKQLENTVKSVREIAEASGYADANYFTKVFRRKMNVTPMEYREKCRKLDSKKLRKGSDKA